MNCTEKNVLFILTIYSKSFDEHIKGLENVFKQLELHGIKLKASLCEFFQDQCAVSRTYIFSAIRVSRHILTTFRFERLVCPF